MIALTVSLVAVALVIAAAIGLAAAGFRAGDRPEDATVTAVPGTILHPDGYQRVVTATVRNPGPVPVLAGLSVHRSRVPGWLGAGMSVTVPFRTGGRRYRPSAQATLGVVQPGDSAHWSAPAPDSGRRCHLVAVIGQSSRRLRVIRLPVSLDTAGMAAPGGGARTDPLSWLDDDRTP